MAPFGLPFGTQVGPSSVQDGSRDTIFQKNVIFHKTSATRGRVHSVTSRGHRKRPKIAPRRSQDGLKEVLFRCSILCSLLVRFWFDFGAVLAPQMGHFGGGFSLFFRTSLQGRPKIASRGAKRLEKAARETPRESREAPRAPKKVPKRPQEAPRGANSWFPRPLS